ncbi:hypothetical protein LIPSTDRAFT_73557 [Lipomyces starkeyi NRRL Y-11557]|uniref:Uncharacterized protein n=1 Tax=Lipomyces starkeyi NRRL Y-11557 TaxID=675824 RepID=A0A1E3Q278_LIPST|nr:hypothetical protein LIPSTDRAFT_73557 [Lipomyces starkeyi NRRL Y-11557]
MSTYKDSAADFTTESFYKQLKIAFEDRPRRIRPLIEKPTYEAYCLQVKNIAEFKRLSISGAHTRGNFAHAPTASHEPRMPDETATADAMDWEPSIAKSSKRAKWVSKEELDRRRQLGQCMRCCSSRHLVKGFPFLPPKRPFEVANAGLDTLKVSEIEIRDAVLDEDDTDTKPIDEQFLQGKVKLQ